MPIKDHPLSIALPQPGSRCFGQCSDNLRTGPWHRGMDAAGGSLMKHEKTHVLFNVSFSMDPPSLSAAQTSAIPSPRNKMNSNIHFEKRNTKVEPLTLGHPFLFVKLFTVSPFRRFAFWPGDKESKRGRHQQSAQDRCQHTIREDAALFSAVRADGLLQLCGEGYIMLYIVK